MRGARGDVGHAHIQRASIQRRRLRRCHAADRTRQRVGELGDAGESIDGLGRECTIEHVLQLDRPVNILLGVEQCLRPTGESRN